MHLRVLRLLNIPATMAGRGSTGAVPHFGTRSLEHFAANLPNTIEG